MKEVNKCAVCGNFMSWSKLYSMGGENNESWFECEECLSPYDRERLVERKCQPSEADER